MKSFLIFLLLLLVAVVPGAAQETPTAFDYEQFTLPNGLEVILQRDPSAPLIATNIWYRVGSAHERPGRTGFAHLFEHLMFEGSANVPRGKIDEWFEEAGGSPNGTTSRDRTNYMQTFSSNALNMALFIESDRMGYLLEAMSPEVVDGQRDVVKNERRQSYENRPYGLASQIIAEHLYPDSHPYSWPVIGYMDDLSAASYEDVVNFFGRFYAPNNASLAIVGDIDIEEARGLVEEWFTDLPSGEPVPPLEVPRWTRREATRLVLEDRVQLPRLYMAWVTPPAYEPDDAALIALASLLADGRNSRLYRRLVYERQIADDVSAIQRPGTLASDFTLWATARGGHTLEELEAAILEELGAIAAEAPSATELERVLNQHEVAFLERLERIGSRADLLNHYLFYTGSPDYVGRDLERFRELTPEQVTRAAAAHLDPANAVILSVVPQGRTDLAAPNSRAVLREGLSDSPAGR